MSDIAEAILIEITSEIGPAYLAQDNVAPVEIPALISSVHAAFATIGKLSEPAASEPEKPRPAIPVKEAVTDEYIISLEDGRELKSMKRCLAGPGMTPADHRAKWGLPSDCLTVSPAYAQQRSATARSIGLGGMRKTGSAYRG